MDRIDSNQYETLRCSRVFAWKPRLGWGCVGFVPAPSARTVFAETFPLRGKRRGIALVLLLFVSFFSLSLSREKGRTQREGRESGASLPHTSQPFLGLVSLWTEKPG